MPFFPHLHLLDQRHIPNRTLIMTNMVWRRNQLNKLMQRSFIREQLYVMKKNIEDLQDQKQHQIAQ